MESNSNVHTDINYIRVLEYLKNNRGLPYSKPEVDGISNTEKQRLLGIKAKGKAAVKEMKKMVKKCSENFGLDKCEPMSWLDGSNTKTRNYLWAQMKYSDYGDEPVSISIFVEFSHLLNDARYRFSLEIKNDGTDKKQMNKYHSFLDVPLQSESSLVYVSGSNEFGEPAVINENVDEIKEKLSNGTYKKVQLCQITEWNENMTNDDFEAAMLKGVSELIPYYEHVIGLIKDKSQDKQKKINELEIMKDKASTDIVRDHNVNDAVDHIYNFISSEGFSYKKSLIKNLYLSLKTKPFVILSGISGTGKSKIVELFAKSMDATAENGRFRLISVKPDWSDGTDLLGYRNIEGEFICGQITKAAFDATNETDKPYFICLDEMNLARVEYYFSDILSKMETRRFNNQKQIITNNILQQIDIGNDSEAAYDYSNVCIPENLYIIGTVNMDETTFPFSKKVLDRANTIEFNKVNLDYSFEDYNHISDSINPLAYDNKLLRSEFLKIKDCYEYKGIALMTIEKLKSINDVLEKYNDLFGYRVRDEIVFYMIYAQRDNLFNFEEAFNLCILQKILPKINGSSRDTLDELIDLYNLFNEENKIEGRDLQEEDIDALSIDGAYPDVNEKLIYMMRRFVRDGFTTFWH